MARGPQQLAVVVLAVAVLAPGRAVDFGLGPCPAKSVVRDFDVARYMGDWFELERFWQIFELNGKCSKARYVLNATTGEVVVRNSMVDIWSNQEKSIEGVAALADPASTEAKLTVTFKIPVIGERRAPYWVLDTDYDSFALVYSCSAGFSNLVRAESAWILARAAAVTDPALLQTIEDAVKKVALNRASFQKTEQDCQGESASPRRSNESPSRSNTMSTKKKIGLNLD